MLKTLKSYVKKCKSKVLRKVKRCTSKVWVTFSIRNSGKLLEAALAPPPRNKIQTCHNAVLYWIKKAGLITQGKFDQIERGTKAGSWDAVLANNNDNLVQNFPQGLANVPCGAIIGFFEPSWIPGQRVLQHSMVVVKHKNGNTYVAGVNNLNVVTGNLAAKIKTNYAVVKDHDFNPIAQNVEVRWVDINTLLQRLP